jgi:hypothetical protein
MHGAVASLDVEVCTNSNGDDVLLLVERDLGQNIDEVAFDEQLNENNNNNNNDVVNDIKQNREINNTISSTLSEKLLAADCGFGLLTSGLEQDDEKEATINDTMASNDVGQTTAGKAIKNNNEKVIDASEVEAVDEKNIMKYSNLFPGSNNRRTIWIVTTAALPWRTGTSVNPLWRAVYLAQDGHKVTLLIPWLDDIAARKKLYGSQNFFPGGSNEQREWLFANYISKYKEEKQLVSENFNIQIQFWNGTYQESFGSIFPIEDLCSLIPSEEADVAILEEPEHLNWFRVIHSSTYSGHKTKKNIMKAGSPTTTAKVAVDNAVVTSTESSTTPNDNDTANEACSIEDDEDTDEVSLLYGCPAIPTTKTVTDAIEATTRKLKFSGSNKDDVKAADTDTDESTGGIVVVVGDDEYDVNVIGWCCKFRYVIGILHTNYGDYIRQYGVLGTSLIGASALHALSSLVVRAYCHKVIKLSGTLPSYWTIKHNPAYKYPAGTSLEGLAEFMETTCNVHGVRTDFLDPPVISKEKDSNIPLAAPVYFIGKLIWAKGFEQALELQELFKSKTGDYFPIDVYGTGNDEKAIQRAFFGRHNPISRGESNISTDTSDSSSGVGVSAATVTEINRPILPEPTALAPNTGTNDRDSHVVIGKKKIAKSKPVVTIFDSTMSLRSEIDGLLTNPLLETNVTYPAMADIPGITLTTDLASEKEDTGSAANTKSIAASIEPCQNNDVTVDPLAILSDVTQRTVGTGVETADATVRMVESLIQKGLGLFSFSGDKVKGKVDDATAASQNLDQCPNSKTEGENADQRQQRGTATTTNITDQHSISIPFHLAPARARFKWRRHPIPARFLGVQDHIVVRDIPQTKIFLNLSTSEVLCTTSAEALAMGKFVILPKHRKCFVAKIGIRSPYILNFPSLSLIT